VILIAAKAGMLPKPGGGRIVALLLLHSRPCWKVLAAGGVQAAAGDGEGGGPGNLVTSGWVLMLWYMDAAPLVSVPLWAADDDGGVNAAFAASVA
jgi:hypothetical protein